MLKIRLKRTGRKHDPSYRLIVVESTRGPKSGKYIENLGLYDPRRDLKQIDVDHAKYWISEGAQTSGTAHNLLVDLGVITDSKVNVLPQKSPVKSEEEAAPESEAPTEEPAEEQGEENGEEAPETSEDTDAAEAETEAKPTAESEPATAGEENKE